MVRAPDDARTLGEVLRLSSEHLAAKGVASPRVDAEHLLGHALEARAKTQTMTALRRLARLQPATARVKRGAGEVEVPNYELEAIGLGLWQVGQERLTDPYVARYFDEVLATRQNAARRRRSDLCVDARDLTSFPRNRS